MNVSEILDDLPPRNLAWLDSDEAAARLSASLVSGVVKEQWKYTPIKGFIEGFSRKLARPVSGSTDPVAMYRRSGESRSPDAASWFMRRSGWIPACAGMTCRELCYARISLNTPS